MNAPVVGLEDCRGIRGSLALDLDCDLPAMTYKELYGFLYRLSVFCSVQSHGYLISYDPLRNANSILCKPLAILSNLKYLLNFG
jgi:hypothetical protein